MISISIKQFEGADTALKAPKAWFSSKKMSNLRGLRANLILIIREETCH